jgi:hypothetical protein
MFRTAVWLIRTHQASVDTVADPHERPTLFLDSSPSRTFLQSMVKAATLLYNDNWIKLVTYIHQDIRPMTEWTFGELYHFLQALPSHLRDYVLSLVSFPILHALIGLNDASTTDLCIHLLVETNRSLLHQPDFYGNTVVHALLMTHNFSWYDYPYLEHYYFWDPDIYQLKNDQGQTIADLNGRNGRTRKRLFEVEETPPIVDVNK